MLTPTNDPARSCAIFLIASGTAQTEVVQLSAATAIIGNTIDAAGRPLALPR